MKDNLVPRRIQYTGRSTYVVSLPKKWVIENEIHNDRLIYIYKLSNNALLLVPQRKRDKQSKEALIKVDENLDIGKIIRRIIAYYIKGFDVIKVYSEKEYLSPTLKNRLKDRIKRLIFGSEFLDETAEYLSIHIIASSVDLDIITVINRMAGLAINMHRDTIKALRLHNSDMLREIIDRDDDMDRLYFLSVRMLNEYSDVTNLDTFPSKISNLWELMEYRAVVRYLERVADHATIIATSMNTVIGKYGEDDVKTLDHLNSISIRSLELAIEALTKMDINKAEEAISLKHKVRQIEDKAVSKLAEYTDPELISSLRMSIESCRRVFEYGAGIAEIAINLGY